jgi:hypothetical protein
MDGKQAAFFPMRAARTLSQVLDLGTLPGQ